MKKNTTPYRMPKEHLGKGSSAPLSRKSPFSTVAQISRELSPWIYAKHPNTKAKKKKGSGSGY